MIKRVKNEVYRIDNYGDIDTWDIIDGLKKYCKSEHDLELVEEGLYSVEVRAENNDYYDALYRFLIDASGTYDFGREYYESRKVKESIVDFVETYNGKKIYVADGIYTVSGIPKFDTETFDTDYITISSKDLKDLKRQIDKADREYRKACYDYID